MHRSNVKGSALTQSASVEQDGRTAPTRISGVGQSDGSPDRAPPGRVHVGMICPPGHANRPRSCSGSHTPTSAAADTRPSDPHRGPGSPHSPGPLGWGSPGPEAPPLR